MCDTMRCAALRCETWRPRAASGEPSSAVLQIAADEPSRAEPRGRREEERTGEITERENFNLRARDGFTRVKSPPAPTELHLIRVDDFQCVLMIFNALLLPSPSPSPSPPHSPAPRLASPLPSRLDSLQYSTVPYADV